MVSLTGKIIDLDQGSLKASSDLALAKEMVVMLVDECKQFLPKLIAARDGDDWQVIQAMTHKLRGGSAFCGAPRLNQACAYLETALIAHQNSLRDLLFCQLTEEINSIIAELTILGWHEK